MSFLAPLYFLGALAVAGPIVFHLIRRQPKGQVEFSSLMFLDSTPPRLTRRSRLENWPLLLLRCAAILMLAFAFARPFLPMAESDSVSGIKRAIVLLVDQSASMKRTGLWDQATKRAIEILESADDQTLVSVIAFDLQPHTILSLQESMGLIADDRKGAARDALSNLSPTWQATDLGQAIRYAADQATLLELADVNSASGTSSAAVSVPAASGDAASGASGATLQTRIVLLSDLQSGAQVETLQGYQWPDRVWLDVQTLTPVTRGNVSLRVLPQTLASEQAISGQNENADTVRVQVTQTDDGDRSTFRLRFVGQEDDADVVQVPAGQSRFFSIELPRNNQQEDGQEHNSQLNTATLQVFGDSDDFDNLFHFVRPRRIHQSVLFLEPERVANDGSQVARSSLSFFAKQIPWSETTRDVQLLVQPDDQWSGDIDPGETPLLICATSPALARNSDAIDNYLQSGGRVLVVLDQQVDDVSRSSIARWLAAPDLEIGEAEESEFNLIASVDFGSGVIAPLAHPGVNDFSNIRIWNHRKIAGLGEDNHVILKLDDGLPLLVHREVTGKTPLSRPGNLWVLSTGWQPAQSQFALSTKFVPILLGMLGPNLQIAPASRVVGDPIGDDGSADHQIATEPGIIQLDDGTEIAVNLAAVESQTERGDAGRIAEFGAVVSSLALRQQDETAKRALRDVELESRQGWWQWLVLATLGLIAAETLLAAKNRTDIPRRDGNE